MTAPLHTSQVHTLLSSQEHRPPVPARLALLSVFPPHVCHAGMPITGNPFILNQERLHYSQSLWFQAQKCLLSVAARHGPTPALRLENTAWKLGRNTQRKLPFRFSQNPSDHPSHPFFFPSLFFPQPQEFQAWHKHCWAFKPVTHPDPIAKPCRIFSSYYFTALALKISILRNCFAEG